MTVEEFRTAYPAFAAVDGATIQHWLNASKNFIDDARWGDLADMGRGLFVAHWLASSAMDERAAGSDAIGGASAGIVTSKSVGGVSFSYDVSSVASADAGMWNQTSYGRKYWRLAQMFGNGGLQL